MSESCREHRPLLRDEFLDEEPFEYSPHQRRHMGYRGRARNNIKGAAAIIKNWPDHWTVSVSYWWIGFGMIAITIFIIYNSILYASLPTAYSKLIKRQPILDTIKASKLPEIFMHVVVNSEKEADLNKYLPYIEIISTRHIHYKFNLIVLFNDTSQIEKLNHQAKLNNDEALNSLWTVNDINNLVTTPSEKFSNIIIKQMNLSSYLNASPLRYYWRQIPHQFIEFLVRSVSVWEKGGITFNPIILTPRSPHSIYIEKLHNLLQTYQVPKLNMIQNADQNLQNIIQKKNRNGHKRKARKRVNNIREIIDAMDSENSSQSEPAVLSEAENRQVFTKVEMKPYLNSLFIITKEDNVNITGNMKLHEKLGNDTKINPIIVNAAKNAQSSATEKLHFLPSFFDFLFRDKSMYEATTTLVTKRSSRTIPAAEWTSNEEEKDNIIQPMIIPAPTVFDRLTQTEIKDNISRNHEYEDYLTIDLKGNLLSTRTPCHAFIGSVFNNVKHCTEEGSLKDFIISELSLFCKGLLSTCKGIDVILL